MNEHKDKVVSNYTENGTIPTPENNAGIESIPVIENPSQIKSSEQNVVDNVSTIEPVGSTNVEEYIEMNPAMEETTSYLQESNVSATSEAIPVMENQTLMNEERVPQSEISMDHISDIESTKKSNEVVIEPQENIGKKQLKKEKKKRKKQKDGGSGYGCASFLFLIIIFLVSYILFDKGIVSYDKKTNEFKFMQEEKKEETSNSVVENKEDDASYYVSSDGRYFLMLGHENRYIQSSSENQPYFVLDIYDNDTHELVTGGYQVRGNTITLVFASGCKASNGDFSCTLPVGAKVTNLAGTNMMTLPYTEDQILLENVTLTNEKNLTTP